MNLKKLVFLFLVLFTIIHTGKATHIVGGEFNYTDLGNGNYRLSLKVYRDCFNGVPLFDDPAKVNIFNAKTGVFLGNFFKLFLYIVNFCKFFKLSKLGVTDNLL